MRQPLSGIESLTYYMGLVLADDPELAAHCDRLRRLVHQVSWLVEDASFASCCATRPNEAIDFTAALRRFAEEQCGSGDQPLTVEIDDGLPLALLPRGAAPRLLEHLLAVFRDIAATAELPVFRCTRRGDGIRLLVTGAVADGAMQDVMRAVLPSGGRDGLARFAESLGGAWDVRVDSGSVTLDLTMPARLAIDMTASAHEAEAQVQHRKA